MVKLQVLLGRLYSTAARQIRRAKVLGERGLNTGLRRFDTKWPFIWRFIFCYLLGCLFLTSDQTGHFDKRLQLRNPGELAPEVVVILLRPFEMQLLMGYGHSGLLEPAWIGDVADSFFWDKTVWHNLLREILRGAPKKIGVGLFFPPSLAPKSLNRSEQAVFFDERIIWGSLAHQTESYLGPMFGKADRSNQGFIDLVRDEDGLVRKVPSQSLLGQINLVESMLQRSITPGQYINYQADPNQIRAFSAREVLNGSIPVDTFKDKLVLIGSDQGSAGYLTPKGRSNRVFIWAEILTNELKGLWIKFLPFYFYLIYLCLVGLLTLWIVTSYPQSVSLFFLAWLGALLAALSLWTFDTYAIWLPMASIIFMISVSWIVFGFYRTALAEQKAALLMHERQSLEEFEELKNNFMSLISHDLKTPIAKIKAVTDRLKIRSQSELSGPTSSSFYLYEELNALTAYTDELYRYIQMMLTLLKAETKAFKPRYESVDLNELIKTAVDRIEPLAKAKSISLKVKLEPLFLLEADPTLMTEVILNLIDNAIKYSPEGHEVQIRSYESDNKVWVEVKDQGAGIAKDEMAKVFQKFIRGKDQAESSKGHGLGLYLVKYFVELHQGEVYLESQPSQGTTVRFFLPLEG